MNQLSFLTLSTTDWDAPQVGSRQQIARELSRRGHRVLFVEVPRALHSLISDPAGTRRALRRMGRVRQVPDGTDVYTPPPFLPVYYNPSVNAINQRLLLAYLRGTLGRLGRRVDVLWTYWPNTAYLVGRIGERVAVYHCIDDFAAAGYPLTPPGAIARMEAEQCRKVDLVLVRTERLADQKRAYNPNTYLLPGGVDTAHFDPSGVANPRPDVAALPRPRVGMVGTIDDRVDVALLGACAAAMPDTTFVLVGPVRRHRIDVQPLGLYPNVRLLPPCPHSEVPAITAALDVCLIPYRVNAYTEGLSPIKLHECLAMGKPVVATDLPYVRREAAHVRIARTPAEFALAIQHSLDHPPTPETRSNWRAAAEVQSWSAQVDQIERLLGEVLGASL